MPIHIESIHIANINVAAYNPRVDLARDSAEYQAIKRSMDTFGVVEPLIWNQRTRNLVGGHQRFKILKDDGATVVDVSVVDLDETQEKALNIALNKVSGTWDGPRLADVLLELQQTPDYWASTGFTDVELENILRTVTAPVFAPNNEPTIESQAFTPDDVQRTRERMGERFTQAREIRDVTCPHCGGSFGLDPV